MTPEELQELKEIIGNPEKIDAIMDLFHRIETRKKQEVYEKQAAGIVAARERGVKFGRPPLKIPKNFPQIYENYKAHNLTGAAAAGTIGISEQSFRKLVRLYEAEHPELHNAE